MAVRSALDVAPTPVRPRLRRPLLAIFVASGAAGLVYQVVWSRELVLVFGNTSQAVSTIVTAFLGGLGLGGLAGGRIADRSPRPLRFYAALELGIAACGLVLPFVFERLGLLYRGIYGELLAQPGALVVVRFLLAFAALAPATFLMGMTLPALTRHLVRSLDEAGARLGELYAANTLGAMAGTLLAGFVLIEFLGLLLTSYVAVSLNLLAGLGALLLGRREGAVAAEVPAAPAPAAAPRGAAEGAPRRRLVLLAMFVSGYVTIALEVLWTRMLAEGTGQNIYVFTSILGTYLLGIGLGSVLYRRLGSAERDRLGVLGLCLAGVGLAALSTVVIGSGSLGEVPFPVEVITVLLPATVLMGYGFPLAGRLVTPSVGESGSSVGLLYALNTFGSILGSFSAAFVLAATVGTNRSVLLLGAINLVVGAGLLVAERGARVPARLAAGGLAALAAGSVLASSLSLPITRTSTENALLRLPWPVTHDEDELATVDTVGGPPASRRLLIGGVGMTALTVDTKLMAHLSKAFRPQARDFLVVAMGMGSTYRSGLRLGLRTDVVELSPTVPERMHVFHPDADRWLQHPDGRVIVSDGRNYVKLSEKQYDLIAVDPAPPIESAGSVVLYTREFMLESKARLRPGGVFLLWIPYATPMADFKTHVRTLASAFRHTHLLLAPGGNGVFMFGSDSPLELQAASLRAVLGHPEVLRDLAEAPDNPASDAQEWEAVIRRAGWLADEEVRAFAGPGPVITDDRPRSEYYLWRRAFMKDRSYVNERMLRAAGPDT